MKVLFVCSGNKHIGPGIIVQTQANSLKNLGLNIEFFTINKKGILGYFGHILHLRKHLKSHKYDIIHAHYSLSAFVASLAGRFPLVVSLMGSDAYLSGILRFLARFFYKNSWDAAIVKTQRMKDLLKMNNAIVLPNGVNTERFCIIHQKTAREKIGFNEPKKLVVFVADPTREEKNFDLAQKAFQLLNIDNVELLVVYNVSNELIPYYLNAADVLLLTSKWEGSVNVVKEAMACNCPIVSTDVGDVRLVIGNTAGCFLTLFDPVDVAAKVKQALAFNSRTNGRERIMELGLDSQTVAKRIISIYEQVKCR